jgi:hypothetical protein
MIWIGGEIDHSVADAFRTARNRVEKTINTALAGKTYELPVDAWDCIAIIRQDYIFHEVHTISLQKRTMDFRLCIDYETFRQASQRKQQALIFAMLLRSLALLREKVGDRESIIDFEHDVREIGVMNKWIQAT